MAGRKSRRSVGLSKLPHCQLYPKKLCIKLRWDDSQALLLNRGARERSESLKPVRCSNVRRRLEIIRSQNTFEMSDCYLAHLNRVSDELTIGKLECSNRVEAEAGLTNPIEERSLSCWISCVDGLCKACTCASSKLRFFCFQHKRVRFEAMLPARNQAS